MTTRLRAPKLEQKPKTVHVLRTWRDTQRTLDNPEMAKKVAHIRRCIENGTPLPSSYYRKGVDLDTDRLLEAEGYIHLHLGKTNTDELLWLVQYDDHVVLLEVSDHSHFVTRPTGKLLRSIHAAALGMKENELAVAARVPRKGGLERSPPKWMPVRRKRALQNKGLEPCPIARRSGTALECLTKLPITDGFPSGGDGAAGVL